MNCQFPDNMKKSACIRCGYVLKKNYPGQVTRKCNGKPLIGDRVSGFLSQVGVTEENYKHAKQAIGFAPNCNCKARKEFFNKVHRFAKRYGWAASIRYARRLRKKASPTQSGVL